MLHKKEFMFKINSFIGARFDFLMTHQEKFAFTQGF